MRGATINSWLSGIVYIGDIAARFGSTDADEFALQQQNVNTNVHQICS